MVEEKQPLALVDDSSGEATRLFVPGQPVNMVIKAESNFYQVRIIQRFKLNVFCI